MKATLTTLYENNRASDTIECTVLIIGSNLVLSYSAFDLDDHAVVYEGSKTDLGDQWIVKCAGLNGTGTLSRSPLNEDRLEGGWAEHGQHGMWYVDLEAE